MRAEFTLGRNRTQPRVLRQPFLACLGHLGMLFEYLQLRPVFSPKRFKDSTLVLTGAPLRKTPLRFATQVTRLEQNLPSSMRKEVTYNIVLLTHLPT